MLYYLSFTALHVHTCTVYVLDVISLFDCTTYMYMYSVCAPVGLYSSPWPVRGYVHYFYVLARAGIFFFF